MASRWLRFIFQLPAMSGRRVRHVAIQSSRAARPGSVLALEVLQATRRRRWRCARTPSSSKPSARTAAAESPPPTTVNAVDLGDAPRRPPRVPAGERRQLEHAHRAVPEHGPARRRARSANSSRRLPGRCRGPSGRPGSRRRRRRRASASAANAVGRHDVDRQHDLDARASAPVEVAAHGVELVLLEQRLADLVALGLEEGEAPCRRR